MGILLTSLRISGFRAIKEISVDFSRTTVLIGANNSGKTSVLKGLQLALGDYGRYLSEEDFHIGNDEKSVESILIDVKFVPVNERGELGKEFDEEWTTEFGDRIKAEANGQQFLALRTRCIRDQIKGGFHVNRSTLEKWPDFSVWQSEKIKETKLTTRLLSVPFISIEAQRDIHLELKEKSSFVGKVLSGVEYNEADVKALEERIKVVNIETVEKSGELKGLKNHLETLNQSFQGSGEAEITPFPKKIRDLSKHFSVHFGEKDGGSFSMEYHGMGTRSWASMLTVKAFTEMIDLTPKNLTRLSRSNKEVGHGPKTIHPRTNHHEVA